MYIAIRDMHSLALELTSTAIAEDLSNQVGILNLVGAHRSLYVATCRAPFPENLVAIR